MKYPKIPRIVMLLWEIWQDNPDLRLMQLLLDTVDMKMDGEVAYYVKDEDLEKALKKFYLHPRKDKEIRRKQVAMPEVR